MKRSTLPVDQGWAWLIMLGNFINWLVAIGFIRALSILFPVFLQKYDQPVAVTTLAFGIAEITESTANVLIPLVFLSRFTVRSLCLGGALCHAASIMSLAFTPNIVLVNVLFGCIGFSRGFILNPQVYILGYYFKRRLSFASACANMGVSMATMMSPLVTRFLLDAYNLEWTFMIIGAFSLHSVFASLLFRPPSTYQNDISPNTNSNDDQANVVEETEKSLNNTQGQLTHIHNETDLSFKSDANKLLENVNENDATSTKPEMVRNDQNHESGLHITSKYSDLSTADDSERELMPENHVTDTRNGVSRVNAEKTQSLIEYTTSKKTASNFKQWLRRSLSQTICSKPVALLLIIASGLGVHTQAGNVYLPVLGLENGLTEDQLPWLLTITGASDIVGKLFIGLLADKGCIPVLYIACITQTIPGIALQMAPLYQGMGAMASLCAMYGLMAGILHILLPTLIIRMVGLPSLPRVISGYFLLNCVVTFSMHVVVGVVKDATGSFVGGFQFVGCLFLSSVVVLLVTLPVSKKSFSWCWRRWHRERDGRSEDADQRETPS